MGGSHPSVQISLASEVVLAPVKALWVFFPVNLSCEVQPLSLPTSWAACQGQPEVLLPLFSPAQWHVPLCFLPSKAGSILPFFSPFAFAASEGEPFLNVRSTVKSYSQKQSRFLDARILGLFFFFFSPKGPREGRWLCR